jgi:hypothetical protein
MSCAAAIGCFSLCRSQCPAAQHAILTVAYLPKECTLPRHLNSCASGADVPQHDIL